MSKTALIVGCGYVGSHLKKRLRGCNWQVHGITRSAADNNDDLKIDVGKEFSLDTRFDVVFYLVSADTYTSEAYELAYQRGVINTLQALAKTNQKPRFIFVSSTSIFSENQGNIVEETSAITTAPFSKKYLNAGELLVWKSDLPAIVVRFSGIYGPGRYRLVEQLKAGKSSLKEAPFISNRVHLEDCAGILHHLATAKNPAPLYIGSDSEPTAYNDIVTWLAKELAIATPKKSTELKPSLHRSNKRCSNKLLLQSGYSFLFPSFREGFRSCL